MKNTKTIITLVGPEPTKRTTVESIMNEHLITLEADSTALQAAKLMSEKMLALLLLPITIRLWE